MSTRPLALVTGARRGIGAAIAVELAARGFDLVLTDLSTEGAGTTVEAAASKGARVRFVESDLARIDAHEPLVRDIVQRDGPIACLVNNAGIPAPARGDLLDIAPEAFDRVVGVNLRGTFFLSQAVARHMVEVAVAEADREQPRTLVTISSVSAELASIERGEYCMSKAGLAMMNRLLALRLAPLGIGVFEVRPGIIRTPMTESVAERYDRRIADGLVPMARWGTPDDVATLVGTLATGRLGFATGSILHADGALSVPRL